MKENGTRAVEDVLEEGCFAGVDAAEREEVEPRKQADALLGNDHVYRDWQKRTESLGYNFQQDLDKVNVDTFDQLFEIGNQYPKVVESYLSGDIHIESAVILNKLTNFMSRADKKVSDPILWPDVSRKIRKYSLLMNVDTEKMKKIVFKVFTS